MNSLNIYFFKQLNSKLLVRVLLFFVFILNFNVLFSQENSDFSTLINQAQNPSIQHYTQQDFDADAQFWSVTEDERGVMYFGNNDGILIYDGSTWKKIKLPNSSSVRSLAKDQEGTIYAGGYNDLGKIIRDDFGNYQFKSLKDTLQLANVSFENIWQINVLDDNVIFRSFKKLFLLKNGNITQIPSRNSFIESFIVNGRYFVQDANEGIYEVNLKTSQIKKFIDASAFNNESVIYISYDFEFFTNTGKIFRKKGNGSIVTQSLFSNSNDQIISALKYRDQILLGTLSQGLIILSKKNNQFRINAIDNLKGQTVLNLFQTQKDNVWALLDNGLEFLNYNSPRITLFNLASVYDAQVSNQNFLIATNKGVYYSSLANNTINSKNFDKLNSIQGQAWSFSVLNKDLFVNHDKGLYKINKDLAVTRIGNIDGIWKTIPLKEKENTYLICTYSGIYTLEQQNKDWKIINKIEGFDESSRDILPSNEAYTYWVCHGYKGVYKITFSEDLDRTIAIDHYTDKNGLPSPFNINVFKWKNEIVFSTNKGAYIFNDETKKFEPFNKLNNIIDTERNPRKILQKGDKTWIVQDDELGYFETNSKNPLIEKDIFLQTKGTFNRGMESIIPISNNNVLVGTHTGLYLYNLQKQKELVDISTDITGISYSHQNETYLLPISSDSIVELPNNFNSIKFSFAAPNMPNNLNNTFSYQLEGIDNSWSNWQKLSFKEYSLLKPGSYTFKVRSKNVLGNQSKPAEFNFYVQPKWYETNSAMVIYVILFIGLFILSWHLVKRKITREKEKSILKEQRTNKLLQLEIDQLKLQKDKEKIEKDKEHLEQDILLKSKELANYTMLLVNKKNFFSTLQEDLKELKNIVKSKQSNQKILEIFKKMHQNKIDEEYLAVFDSNFENVHQDFFRNLKNVVPNLTKKELRLSAFIKMGLSNKDIAPLLGISVRGVETARYRFRKKLNLDHDDKLVEFFESLSN
ncbi:MAG TPA: hypothetical protein EYO36_06475 [Mesonia sp.]|nr:hypothetical protein [Mesonia sp.]